MQELIKKRHNKSISYRTLKYLIVQCIYLIFSLCMAALMGALCTQIVHSSQILSLFFSCNYAYLVSPKSFEVLTFWPTLNLSFEIFLLFCILFLYFLSFNHGMTVWPFHIPVQVKWCNTWLRHSQGLGIWKLHSVWGSVMSQIRRRQPSLSSLSW